MDISRELALKQTSCVTSNTLIKYAEFRNLDIKEFLEDVPYPYGYLTDTHNWMLHEHIKTLYRRLNSMLHDEMGTFKAGIYSHELRTLGVIEVMARLIAGPEIVYNNCSKISWKFNRVYEMTPIEVTSKSAIIQVKYFPEFEATVEGCRYTEGILTVAPTAWMLPKAEIKEDQCQANGADSCIYRLSFQEKRSFFKNVWFQTIGKAKFIREAKNELEQNYQLLEKQRDELLIYQHNLEERIMERTAQLDERTRYAESQTLEANQQRARAEQTLIKLKSAQAQILQSAKMASIGSLAAGIAHEINNPLVSVHDGAQRQLVKEIDQQRLRLQELGLVDKDEQYLTSLSMTIYERISSCSSISTAEERKMRKEFMAVLDKYDITNTRKVAESIINMRLVGRELEKVLDISKSNPVVLEKLCQYEDAISTLSRMCSSSERIVDLVKAVKDYSHLDRGSVGDIDINQSLETVLTMLQGQFKQGIEIKKNYGELPVITGYPRELNQVWTNIITNSIQALEGKGNVTIETSRTADDISVRIMDNGPGIPLEYQERIFDPFFTTKEPGQGTGLGLSISYDIIRHHNGRINLDSKPGNTVFEIIMPIYQDKRDNNVN